MNIALTGTKITQDTKFLAFEKNNSVDVINVIVDTDESWTYKLDVRYPDKCCTSEPLYNIINLTRTGNLCTAIFTSDMLPFAGKYTMQLRGINGDKVSHSDVFDTWVKYSIEPGSTYDPVPSEFYQIEQNVTEMNNNPPYPSDDGYWMIWDVGSHAYKKSDIKAADSLPEINESTNGQYLTNNGDKAYWAEVQTGTESKIDKIEVNGVAQPIVDKTVNIAVPTKTSDLSNDSGYITANDAPVKSVDGATGDVVTNAVKTTAQTLTQDQKVRARDNIDAFQLRELQYFYDTTSGSKHDNDICGANQYSVIYPGNTYVNGEKSNEGMVFPAYVMYRNDVAPSTYKTGLLDANGVAWEIINTYSQIYSIKQITSYVLYVNITETKDIDGNITYHADHTYAEIKAAIYNGKYVCAVYNETKIPFTHIDKQRIIFYFQTISNNIPSEVNFVSIFITNHDLVGVMSSKSFLPQALYINASKNNNVISVDMIINQFLYMLADNLNPIIIYQKRLYHLTGIYQISDGKYRVTFVNPSENNATLVGTNESGEDVWTEGSASNFMTYNMTKNGDNYVLRDQSNTIVRPDSIYPYNCVIEYNYSLYYPKGNLSGTSPTFIAYDDNLSEYSKITINRQYNSLTFTNWQPVNFSGIVSYVSSQTLTNGQKTQARTNIGAGTSDFSGSYNDLTNKPTIPSEYTLPVASSTTLGGVKPVTKTDDMTQDIGVDADGKLWTQPSGLPAVTEADNGKVLCVVNGKWAAVTLPST